jgi:hypothetical protein
MSQIFHPRIRIYWKIVVILTVSILVMIGVTAESLKYSDYIVEERVPIAQPIAFSHKHHVGELAIDCRYCHSTVEKASFAGMPPTHTCMTCHSQLWSQSEMLEPVRRSYKTGAPIHWERVTRMPDYVYFDHSVHVNNGVGCASCHGKINEMPITWRARSFYMEDCLSCHRNPGPELRPKDQIFNLNWKPPTEQKTRQILARKLLKDYKIKPPGRLVDCYVCHR